jgi:4-hydroxy-2-oxoglutarate aldolase
VDLNGIFPALTTPYNTDSSVSLGGIKHNISLYNKTAVAGYVALGSTGEAVMLDRHEADSVLSAVKESAAPEKILIAGTGAESTAETIARTKRAATLGYQIALVKTPYYYKPFYRPEVYVRHYRAVADASPIPVLLYSVPMFTGITLETAEILTLSEHPNILGIKDSSGSIQRIVELLAGAPKAFQVLTGGAAVLYPALVVGARGAILALADAFPEKTAELHHLARGGKHQEAKEQQLLLAQASKRILSENGIAGLKYAMELRGYHGGGPRLPLLPLREENKKPIESMVAKIEMAPARV